MVYGWWLCWLKFNNIGFGFIRFHSNHCVGVWAIPMARQRHTKFISLDVELGQKLLWIAHQQIVGHGLSPAMKILEHRERLKISMLIVCILSNVHGECFQTVKVTSQAIVDPFAQIKPEQSCTWSESCSSRTPLACAANNNCCRWVQLCRHISTTLIGVQLRQLIQTSFIFWLCWIHNIVLSPGQAFYIEPNMHCRNLTLR